MHQSLHDPFIGLWLQFPTFGTGNVHGGSIEHVLMVEDTSGWIGP